MTDAALRALERDAAVTDDPSVEARLLAARLRAGDLLPDAVALAATLGHPAALLVDQRQVLAMPDGIFDTELHKLITETVKTRRRTVAAWIIAAVHEIRLSVSVDPGQAGANPVVYVGYRLDADGRLQHVIRLLRWTASELAEWRNHGALKWCPGRTRGCNHRALAGSDIHEHVRVCERAHQARRVAGRPVEPDVGIPHVMRGGSHSMKMRDVTRRLAEIDGTREAIAWRRMKLAQLVLGAEESTVGLGFKAQVVRRGS